MRTSEIIGYRVVNTNAGFYVATNPHGVNFTTDEEPTPIPRGDALRRMAAFLDANPGEDLGDYEVEPVYRETTPIEDAADELGGLFESLCRRHGLDFGLTRDQINQQLVKDLEAVRDGRGFGPAAFGIPGNGRR